MRYDVPVFFQKTQPGAYDPDTGDYGPDVPVETKKYANITDAGLDTLKLFYGEVKQGSKVVRLQTHFEEPFDRIRIGDKLYQMDFSRRLPTKSVFIVSEVQ